mmetsp:Transcript_27478/g.63053  ORF Transcript_27478/g.63053 Transcript_27478/m.63053 type:complete len:211 (+) Transcript_27478:1341-1973(+)
MLETGAHEPRYLRLYLGSLHRVVWGILAEPPLEGGPTPRLSRRRHLESSQLALPAASAAEQPPAGRDCSPSHRTSSAPLEGSEARRGASRRACRGGVAAARPHRRPHVRPAGMARRGHVRRRAGQVRPSRVDEVRPGSVQSLQQRTRPRPRAARAGEASGASHQLRGPVAAGGGGEHRDDGRAEGAIPRGASRCDGARRLRTVRHATRRA